MNYTEWENGVPLCFKEDRVWTLESYRLSLFLSDIAWHDVTRLTQDSRTKGVADQLYRACGSISANLTEGYSRRSTRDQTRMYEYSLGSARECRDWYYKSRFVLGEKVTLHRMELLTSIIRLLLSTIPRQRSYPKTEKSSVREEEVEYGNSQDHSSNLRTLLAERVPLPEN